MRRAFARGLALLALPRDVNAACTPEPAMNTLAPPTDRQFDARGHRLDYARRALVMGILNVTPDSFSDGGRSAALDDAVANARRMVAQGADIIDIGGESTRPGHVAVSVEEECARVLPVIDALAGCGVPLSIDTQKAAVARAALEHGAHIVNDIWGLMGDADMARVVAAHDAGLVAMHNRTQIDGGIDIVEDMLAFFERMLERAAQAGIRADRISLDPGIGFGKTFEQNIAALAGLHRIIGLGFPVLLGTSRKSFIDKLMAREGRPAGPGERLGGTLASNVVAMMGGCAMIRVHDVAEHVQAMRVVEAVRHGL